MAGGLGSADWERMARQGLRPLSGGDGLTLMDHARDSGEALLVAARLDLGRLSRTGETPTPLLSQLVRRAATGRRRGGGGQDAARTQQGLAARLATLSPQERGQALLQLLRGQTALVLGITTPDSIDAHRPFRDLGFDSLTAVELRNRLNTATGLTLPATMIFDYPTPDALADKIARELVGAPEERAPVLSAFAELEKIESSLEGIMLDEVAAARLETRLRALLAAVAGAGAGGAESVLLADQIQSASDDDMFDFIDNQLGI